MSLERLELRRVGKIVGMEPQVFEVLTYLLRHRDRVVPKTELLDKIWGDGYISESALTSRVKSARRAVGDTGRDQRIIKTIYGRGYRFVADVADKSHSAGPSQGAAPTDGTASRGDVDPAGRVLRAISGIGDGVGAAIQVIGGAGSGKTELLGQVAEAARRQSLAVGLSGPVIASPRPYSYVAEALDEMVRRHPGLLDLIPAGCRTELERAFEGRLPTTRQRWFVAVREFLVTAAERSGAVLLLDDVHLADRESLILVDDLARLTRRYRLVVVVAQRSDAVTRPGFEVVELAERRGVPVDQQAILDLPSEVSEVLRRLAVIGDRFDRLEFTAASGHDVPTADRLLELALASRGDRLRV